MTLHVFQFNCLSDNFGVLLHETTSNTTVSIDAPEADAVQAALQQNGWTLNEIWVTHHHADHVQGIPALRALYPNLRVAAPAAEAERITAVAGPIDILLREGDDIYIGATEAKIIETPGHTAGHIVYYFEEDNLLFAGDTLFAMGCGRVLETPLSVMWNSLMKLAALPGETQIYCGHEYTLSNGKFAASIEPDNSTLQNRLAEVEALRAHNKPTLPTTLALELVTNPFLRADEPGIQSKLNMSGADPAAVFAELREHHTVSQEAEPVTAREIITLLALTPHPEGGYYRQTFQDEATQKKGRAASTLIYFLLEAGQVSAWHRVDAAEDNATNERLDRFILGNDLRKGQRPQAIVPPHAWQSAHSIGQWTLVGCTVAPGFEFEHFELAPSGWDPVRRHNSILKKSIAEVIGNQRPSDDNRVRIEPPVQPEPSAVAKPAPELGLDARKILNSIGDVAYSWDLVSDQLIWGENITDVLPHIAPDRINTGMGFAELLLEDSLSSRYSVVKDSASHDRGDGVAYQVYYSIADSNDKAIWIEDTGRWFAGARAEASHAHGIIRVVTGAYEKRLENQYEAKYDRLTGAYNRDYMTKHLEASLEAALRGQKTVAVLIADIDNIAIINSAYGYDVADEVIAGLAERLRATMRETDILARYAGNKFAFILETCDQDQMPVAAQRFLSMANQKPIETSAGAVHSNLRIGGAIAPRHGRTAQVLLQHAEEALELTRVNASQPFLAYTESLVRQDARLFAAEVTREITGAIAENRVRLAIQPIMDAQTGKVAFSEALIRILRRDGSLIQPDTFLPTAERIGLIKILDQRVLELTVEHLFQNPDMRIAFNVSSATAHDPEWPLRLKEALALRPELAKQLIVEITETFAVGNLDTTRRVIEDMKNIGVSVAMDDFGSGHTSFRGLRHLNFDLIKIDGAFVQNLCTSADDRIFVRALVDLARHIGVPIVAEWVENAQTAALLSEWGVQYLQGFHFGRPVCVANTQERELHNDDANALQHFSQPAGDVSSAMNYQELARSA
eukprot:gene7382-7448_t